MENNNEKIYVAILILAILVIGGIAGYIIWKNTRPEKPEETTTVSVLDNNKYVTSITSSNCLKENCEYNLKLKERTANIKYDKKNGNHILKINNKEVINESALCANLYITSIQNNIIVQYTKNCNDQTTNLIAFSEGADTLFNYQYVDEQYKNSMRINPEEKINIKDNNIILSATRIKNTNKLLYNQDDSVTEVNICDENLLNRSHIKEDEIVTAKYKITLENNSFSKPTMTENITLKDYISRNCT